MAGGKTGGRPVEIICPACKCDAILRREAVYDGLRKTGERLFCSACGHEFSNEASIPFKRAAKPRIFTDEDRSERVDVFRNDERGRNCRHCAHYTVNPFTQRCGLTWRIVEATDTCEKFEPRPTDGDKRGKKETNGASSGDGHPDR